MKINISFLTLLLLLSLFLSCEKGEQAYTANGTLSLQLYQSVFYAQRHCDAKELAFGTIDYSAFDESSYQVTILAENTIVEKYVFQREAAVGKISGTKIYHPGQRAVLSFPLSAFSTSSKDTLDIEVVMEGGKNFRSVVPLIFAEPGDTLSYADYTVEILPGICSTEYLPDYYDGPLAQGVKYAVEIDQVLTYYNAAGRTWVELDVQSGTLQSKVTGKAYDLTSIPKATFEVDFQVLQDQLNKHPGNGKRESDAVSSSTRYRHGYTDTYVLSIKDTISSFYPAFRVYCDRIGEMKRIVLRDCQDEEVLFAEDIMSPTKAVITYLPGKDGGVIDQSERKVQL